VNRSGEKKKLKEGRGRKKQANEETRVVQVEGGGRIRKKWGAAGYDVKRKGRNGN